MRHEPARPKPSLVPDALIASQIGAWETDFANDRTVADAATAALFGVDPDRAAEGLPLAAFATAIHREDRETFYHKLSGVRERGGLFVVEYRTCPDKGVVRWVLARGHYKRDEATGCVVGRGVVIDITDCKRGGEAFLLSSRHETPIDRIAAHALGARKALDELGGHEGSALRRAVDALLWAVGRVLARQGTH